MTENERNPPEKEERVPERNAGYLKNPSPIGTQQNPVSNPREAADPVEEELEAREKFRKKHGTVDKS